MEAASQKKAKAKEEKQEKEKDKVGTRKRMANRRTMEARSQEKDTTNDKKEQGQLPRRNTHRTLLIEDAFQRFNCVLYG